MSISIPTQCSASSARSSSTSKNIRPEQHPTAKNPRCRSAAPSSISGSFNPDAVRTTKTRTPPLPGPLSPGGTREHLKRSRELERGGFLRVFVVIPLLWSAGERLERVAVCAGVGDHALQADRYSRQRCQGSGVRRGLRLLPCAAVAFRGRGARVSQPLRARAHPAELRAGSIPLAR